MWRTGILKVAFVLVFTAVLILSPLSPLVADPQPAAAACVDCASSGDTIELKYDSGIPFAQMSDQYGGCQKCQTYQGVLFALPEGVGSSVLRKVRFYAGGGTANVRVHIMSTGDNQFLPAEYLTPAFGVRVSAEQWYEVDLADVQVTASFWVFLELMDLKVAPFYDESRGVHDGRERSYSGYNFKALVVAPAGTIDEFKRPQGDFLIRAYIIPEVNVGRGEGYDFGTIQGAINSVWDGWRILVHEGTYNENVTVNKSVTIRSVSGPAKTVMQTSPPYSDNNVFRITADCVKLSGFTIQSATYTGRAGVYIDQASGCVISGNVIQDNNYGIYVSEGSSCNILLENECRFNEIGIYIDGPDNYVSGNRLHGNTATVGSAVFLSSVASGNQLRFNTITVDAGTDPVVASSPQIYNQNDTQVVSAVENWWGTDTGPSNAGGQGPLVGAGVQYDPWLRKQPVRVVTVASYRGPFTINGRSETSVVVLKEGSGDPIVSSANFAENPQGEFRYKSLERWFDVLFANSVGVDQVEIRLYYTADEVAALELKEGSLRLFWWNGEKWKKCSKTGVDKDSDFVWARLNVKTKPTHGDLVGTMFAVGVPEGGFAWWLIPVIIFIVVIALFVLRLIWMLLVGRARYTY